MKIISTSILLLALNFITIKLQADFNSTMKLYSTGEYSQAFKEFFEMAKVGEKRSQFNLGIMFYNGQSVAKDINQAYAWIKLSVESDITNSKERNIFNQIASQIADKTQAEIEYQKLKILYSSEVLLERLYPVLVKPVGDKAFTASPIKITEPRWPKIALRKGIQGWVKVQFDIDKLGVPRNVHIFESFPKKIFSKAALKSVPHWRFKPKQNADGDPVIGQQVRYTMEFRLEGANLLQVKEDVYQQTKIAASRGSALAQFKIGIWAKSVLRLKDDINPNDMFLKASIQGLPAAQYELGRSLVFGNGCMTDKTKGLEWLIRSATNGDVEAQLLLGSILAQSKEKDSQLRAVKYFEDVDELSVSAKLDYAWMLASSPYREVSNPTKALEISNDFSKKNFKDDVTIYEIKAASYAALNKFSKAVKLQEEALDEAEDIHADLTDIENHLNRYKQKQTWF